MSDVPGMLDQVARLSVAHRSSSKPARSSSAERSTPRWRAPIIEQLLALSAASNDDITLYLHSPGGHVEAADTIYDMLGFIRPRVIIVGTGWVASAGAHIFLAVPREQRYCLPNTRFLLHQPAGGSLGRATDLEIEAEEILKMRARLNRIISEQTGQPLKKVEKDTERNFWMTAEAAKEYGLVGKIISLGRRAEGREHGMPVSRRAGGRGFTRNGPAPDAAAVSLRPLRSLPAAEDGQLEHLEEAVDVAEADRRAASHTGASTGARMLAALSGRWTKSCATCSRRHVGALAVLEGVDGVDHQRVGQRLDARRRRGDVLDVDEHAARREQREDLGVERLLARVGEVMNRVARGDHVERRVAPHDAVQPASARSATAKTGAGR